MCKLSFFQSSNLLWNKQFSKTKCYLPIFCVWKMELSKRDFRVMMFYGMSMTLWRAYTLQYTKRSPLNIFKQLFGKHALLRNQGQVFFWFVEFRRGRQSSHDVHRCNTPATVVTVTNIEAAEKLIRGEPRSPLERFRKVLASEQQWPCPYCMIIFMSKNDVQGRSPTS